MARCRTNKEQRRRTPICWGPASLPNHKMYQKCSRCSCPLYREGSAGGLYRLLLGPGRKLGQRPALGFERRSRQAEYQRSRLSSCREGPLASRSRYSPAPYFVVRTCRMLSSRLVCRWVASAIPGLACVRTPYWGREGNGGRRPERPPLPQDRRFDVCWWRLAR
jgi:hypothetical protein